MRAKLQSGWGRTAISLVAAIVGCLAVILAWPLMEAHSIKPLQEGQKLAFVAAAFSVMAYNLRTRVIDLILKTTGKPIRITGLCAIARECGRKLTNLVILFTVTMFVLGGAGFIPHDMVIGRYFASVATGLFSMSFVNFIYILFAFERLERHMLDDVEEASRAKEADRLYSEK